MKAWTTLLGTDNYLPAILILEESRQRVKSKHPLIIICFDDLSDDTYRTLDSHNIPYQIFPRINFNGPKRNKDYSCTIGKFYSYILKDVSRFFFIDADSYFVQNIDYLFELPELVLFFYDFAIMQPQERDLYYSPKNISSIIGCIFGDNCSQERFQEALKYSEIFREDEQVLQIFAHQYYHFHLDYQEWTLSEKMVLYHEDSYGFEFKFWNKPQFNPKTFLDNEYSRWSEYRMSPNYYRR